jgi:hypothetical protein
MYPAARRRPPRLARLLDRAWARYDDLTDPQRVLLGVLLTLVLAASALYLLGAASLLALQRLPEAPPASTTAPLRAPLPPAVDEEVEPISPLMADITATPRPTATLRPTSTASPTPWPSPTPPRAGTPGSLGPPPGVRPPGAGPATPTSPALAPGRPATVTPTPWRPPR